MFGVSLSEFAVVLFLAVVLVRPGDMPVVARKVARLWLKIRSFLDRMGEKFEDAAAQGELDFYKRPARRKPSYHEQIERARKKMRLDDDAGEAKPFEKKTPRLPL